MYDYENMKDSLFTESGQKLLTTIITTVHNCKDDVITYDMFVKDVGTYDSWMALACIDYLEEQGFITSISKHGPRQNWLYKINNRQKSVKNYEEGEMVMSIEDIFKHEGFIWRNKYLHQGFIGSWQARYLYNEIKAGRVFVAQKIVSKEDQIND